ncbi:unnamed protein product [Rhodiola kirilowii]
MDDRSKFAETEGVRANIRKLIEASSGVRLRCSLYG